MAAGEELVYVALGGAGEIGMNMYLYGFGPVEKRQWIVVDCGVTFGDMNSSPGVELVLPDVDFIAAEQKNIVGIFITHAHEDHVGALGRLWRRLRAPVYCTRFTAEIAKRKLEEQGLPAEKHVVVVEPHAPTRVGPFDVSFFPVTHSIPEANALVIKTSAGVAFHTGDFKFDAAPIIGAPIDEEALRALGDAGVDWLACDSTNVFEPGSAGSESDVVEGLASVFREARGAVAATSFASNVTRLKTLAETAIAHDRSVVVAGRAMKRMIEASVVSGVLKAFPTLISEEEAADLPPEHVFYLVTGSQGENRAALARIAGGSHPTVSLGEGDTVLYSSRTIPGNEREVYKVYNRLSERGVRVVDADMAKVHVSGHACRDELSRLYSLLRPKYAIPMHGEHRHLSEHARMALDWGAQASIVAPNGDVIRLAENGAAVTPNKIGEVESGRVYLDGEVLVGALDGVIRSRLRLARQGHVSVVVIVDEDGELIADPEVRSVGLPADGEGWPAPLEELIADAVDESVEKLKRRDRESDSQIEDVVLAAARRVCERYWKKKPEMSALVVRLEEEDDER